jgi:hypothetical protein
MRARKIGLNDAKQLPQRQWVSAESQPIETEQDVEIAFRLPE